MHIKGLRLTGGMAETQPRCNNNDAAAVVFFSHFLHPFDLHIMWLQQL